MSFEWYDEFIDLDHKPGKDDLICVFRIEPNGISLEEAAGRVASESSVGTWTTLSTIPDRIEKIKARVFEIQRNTAKISYPLELFEEGNIPQLLSSIAGNVFGMRALRKLRLEDIIISERYAESFPGPVHGIDGVRKFMKIKNRPLTATVPKPKVGFNADEYAKIAEDTLRGGIDLLKDDENLTSQSFIRFEKRLEKVMKVIERVEHETGEHKSYMVNITAETEEMKRRLRSVADYGNRYVMVDIITSGWSSLQTIRNLARDFEIAIHAHRAMHGAFTKLPDHGISIKVITKLSRLAGVDNMHVGTGVGKMSGKAEEVTELARICRGDMFGFKRVFPVSSGGLHPGLVPEIISLFGTDVIIQAGGGIHGHPEGSEAGARALRQAIDVTLEGISLEDGAENYRELSLALKKWGTTRPK